PPSSSDSYPRSLHDALPIYRHALPRVEAVDDDRKGPIGRYDVADLRIARLLVALEELDRHRPVPDVRNCGRERGVILLLREIGPDRKSTRLNSSHDQISYAV